MILSNEVLVTIRSFKITKPLVIFGICITNCSFLSFPSSGMGLKALMSLYYKGAKKFFSAFANYRDIVIVALLLTRCVLEILQITEVSYNQGCHS